MIESTCVCAAHTGEHLDVTESQVPRQENMSGHVTLIKHGHICGSVLRIRSKIKQILILSTSLEDTDQQIWRVFETLFQRIPHSYVLCSIFFRIFFLKIKETFGSHDRIASPKSASIFHLLILSFRRPRHINSTVNCRLEFSQFLTLSASGSLLH